MDELTTRNGDVVVHFGRRPNEIGPVGRQVAANVKAMRAVQSLTTDGLAQRVTSHGRPMLANTITKIERWQRRVDADDLVALARALGTEPADLLASPACTACKGAPPAGFTCNTCGRDGQ